ncbi:alpha/beta hydrolase [Occallatibacter savannae]|uniref:alpha/beta hydrolase n=1 Tax=Occallatibacter savannae TaxID=1002691 RepID=UPI0013A56B51|nr:alpha/beta hydrolase [Occallatibacter savannae]
MHLPHLRLTAEERDRAGAVAEKYHADLRDVEITANDGAVLRAWSIREHGGNGHVVLLLHGQGDNRADMLGQAEMLLRHGFSVLMPDARAHGESGGAITTYGVLEADDVRRWFEWIEKSESPRCIDGLGESMGAAELLRSLDAERGFCAVVAESPFATFREAAYDRLGQEFGRGPRLGRTILWPAFDTGLAYVRVRYGVNLAEADPARAVARSTVPVMLIHGLADTNLPARHSEMIRATSPRVALWEPKAAEHCGASAAEPVEYERRVIEWFEEHEGR